MTRKPLFVPLLLSLATSACGGTSTVSEATATGSAGGEAASLAGRMPPAATDLAPVPAPTQLIGVVRFGALEPTFEAVGRAFGTSAETARMLRQLREGESGSSAVAGLIDVSAGMDLAFVHREEDDPIDVYGFVGPSMREVVGALPRSFAAEPRADGSLDLPAGSAEGSPRRHCSVEPTVRPERTAIVCSSDRAALELARRYLARSLREPTEPGVIRGSIALDSLRARFGDQARAGLALASSMVDAALSQVESPILRNERVRAAISVLARDLIDDVSPLVDELSSVELVARFDESGMTLDFEVGVANPSGSIVRGIAEALRADGAVPPELLERLPPGAVAYVVGHFDSRPFADLVSETRELLAAFAHAGVQLSQADADALDRGLAFALRTSVYDGAVAAGTDEAAQAWSVTHLRYGSSAEATQAVQAYRELVAALRRPGIARAFDQLFADLGDDRPRFTQIGEIRTRGLPAGSYAVRMPPFEQLVSRYVSRTFGAEAPVQPVPAARETFLIPNGTDVLVVQATNGRALYDSLASAGGIGADLRTALLAPGAAMNVVLRLGNVRLPGEGADRETGAPTLESRLGAEAGQAPILVRVRNTGTAPNARFEIDVHAPAAFLRGVTEAGRAEAAAERQGEAQ